MQPWKAPTLSAHSPSTSEALLTRDRTLPPCINPYKSTLDTLRICFVLPSPLPCELLISASTINVCGRKRECMGNTDKYQCQPWSNRSQEPQSEKVLDGVTHMQDQRAACHPVHRLVEQGCRERGRVRGGYAQRKQPQTTPPACPCCKRWSRGSGPIPRPPPPTTPHPVTRSNPEDLQGWAHGFELLICDIKC